MTNFLVNDNCTSARIEFTTKCSACDQDFKQTYTVSPGEEAPWPKLPEGWKRIDRAFYCGNHSLRLVLDGVFKEVYGSC